MVMLNSRKADSREVKHFRHRGYRVHIYRYDESNLTQAPCPYFFETWGLYTGRHGTSFKYKTQGAATRAARVYCDMLADAGRALRPVAS